MQSLPHDVFQKLQQQGAREEESRGRDPQGNNSTAPSRSRAGGGAGDAPTREPSVTLRSPYVSRAPASPPPSPLGRHRAGSVSQRSSEPSRQGRRERFIDRGQAPAPPTLSGSSTRVRSSTGSRAPPASPRPRAPQEVPSQLLGRRLGSNDHFLSPRQTDSPFEFPPLIYTAKPEELRLQLPTLTERYVVGACSSVASLVLIQSQSRRWGWLPRDRRRPDQRSCGDSRFN